MRGPVVMVMACLAPTRGGGFPFLGVFRGASCCPDEGSAGVVALVASDSMLFPSWLSARTA